MDDKEEKSSPQVDNQEGDAPKQKMRGKCKYFKAGKPCPFDDKCLFQHDGQSRKRMIKTEKSKSDRVCKFFQNGQCKFGENCHLRHEKKTDGDNGDSNNNKKEEKKQHKPRNQRPKQGGNRNVQSNRNRYPRHGPKKHVLDVDEHLEKDSDDEESKKNVEESETQSQQPRVPRHLKDLKQTEEGKEVYEQNCAFWDQAGGFAKYCQTINDPRLLEFAKLRRRFATSYMESELVLAENCENDNGDEVVLTTIEFIVQLTCDLSFNKIDNITPLIHFEVTTSQFYPRNNPQFLIKNANLPQKLKRNFEYLLDKIASLQEGMKVYNTIKMFDNQFEAIYSKADKMEERPSVAFYFGDPDAIPEDEEEEKQEEKRTVIQVEVEDAWSQEEQELLEQALRDYPSSLPPKERWASISKVIPNKTARQCVERFKVISVALKAQIEQRKEEEGSDDDSFEEVADDEDDNKSEAFDPDVLHGAECVSLDLRDFEFKNIACGFINNLRLQVMCSKCRGKCDISLNFLVKAEMVLHSRSYTCNFCKSEMVGVLKLEMFHETNRSRIGILYMVDFKILDYLPSDFIITCFKCDNNSRLKEVSTGSVRELQCKSCFDTFRFKFESAHFQLSGQKDNEIIQKILAKNNQTQQKHDRESKKSEPGFQLGNPLPNNGLCKHYKNSFRWFKFPCCNKTYPCDYCHEEEADHAMEWANRMICGHCSLEQPVHKNRCRCGGAVIKGAKTAHWEGGKGCRDPSKMSAGERRKYANLSKTVSKKSQKKGKH